MEDYWDNCLALTVDADNHPRIVWGPYPSEIGIFEYRIYRKHGSGSWELYDTVDDEVYIYTDTTVYINPPGGQSGTDVYYYIKGAYTEKESTVETDPTNTLEVNVRGNEIEKKSGSGNKQIHSFDYRLGQNYPNPFNPSTMISWQSPVDDFVTLKVFDVLGREVATLVDEYREAGTHSIEFNASNLPSGIYLYTIQIGNYLETRKLSLLR